MPRHEQERDGFTKVNDPFIHSDSDSDSEEGVYVNVYFKTSKTTGQEEILVTDTDASYDDTEEELSSVEEPPNFGDPDMETSEPEIPRVTSATSAISLMSIKVAEPEDRSDAEASDLDYPEEENAENLLHSAHYNDSQTNESRQSFCSINNMLLQPRQKKQQISEHIEARVFENTKGASKALVFTMNNELDTSKNKEVLATRKAFEDMRNCLFQSYSSQLKLFGGQQRPRLVLFISENRDALVTRLRNRAFEQNALAFFASQGPKVEDAATASISVEAEKGLIPSPKG
jgi:hypothetical protein